MLALMYDTYHLWFLFVKNGVPPFLLTGLQVVIHGAFLYAEGLGDFQHRESLLAQGACTRRCGLRRALPTPSVHPALLGEGNAGSLALLGVLEFDLRDTKEETRNQMPDGATEVDLRRDGDNSYAALAPVRQHVDALNWLRVLPTRLTS